MSAGLSKPRDRLRIGVQKSGRLTQPSLDLLSSCGLKFRQSRDKLFCFGENMPIDLLLVRDDDIPGMIRDEVCDLGVVGRNEATEQALVWAAQGVDPAPFVEAQALEFGGCRLSIAVPQEWEWHGPETLAGKRIATSYPALTRRYLSGHAVDAQIVELAGSVEIAPKLGTADCICDLVSSGGTLLANQLKEVDRLLESQAVLISATGRFADAREGLRELLLRRLKGVLQVRDAKVLMLQSPVGQLDTICALLPNADVPTVQPGPNGYSALSAVCHARLTWEHLEALKAAGARSIVVLPIEQMLA
jgi:ATP phosphoribosyltransferase